MVNYLNSVLGSSQLISSGPPTLILVNSVSSENVNYVSDSSQLISPGPPPDLGKFGQFGQLW